MPIDRILLGVLLAISVVLLVLVIPSAIRTWATYAGTRSRRQEDFTGFAPDPEPEEAERVSVLEAVGYRRLGDTVTRLPIGEEVARILVAEDGAAYAMLLQAYSDEPGLTGFFSAWPDGTWIGTIHPHGDPLEFKGLRLRVESGTLAEAAASHRATLTELTGRLGEPRRVRKLADMLALDADYRTRFGGRELRPIVVRMLAPVFAILVSAILLALLLASR